LQAYSGSSSVLKQVWLVGSLLLSGPSRWITHLRAPSPPMGALHDTASWREAAAAGVCAAAANFKAGFLVRTGNKIGAVLCTNSTQQPKLKVTTASAWGVNHRSTTNDVCRACQRVGDCVSAESC
jgi:hypothetical protein